MKMTKLTILMIAVVAIGMFALPTSLSVGAGQHKFRNYDTINTSGAAFCAQCHKSGDSVSNELLASDIRGNASGLGYGGAASRIHYSVWCGDCHAITGGYSQTAVTEQHAAQNPSCLKCHGPNAAAAGYPGFNDVTGTNASKAAYGLELNNSKESHKTVYFAQTDDDILCIGCHTYVEKTGTLTYALVAPVVVSNLTIGSGTMGP